MADATSADKVLRIRALNDAFRTTFRGGKVVKTANVAALPEMVVAEAFMQVATFDEFTKNNAPHGEHDFGAPSNSAVVASSGKSVITTALAYGSEDPSDPEKTTRV
jgi:hypothetical protein